MELKKAKALAVDICYQLQPYCDKINIAGSIRRKKQNVKDIEIICLPKVLTNTATFLFGETVSKSYRHKMFVEKVNGLGRIVKGKAVDGKMMQIELPNWIMLDLFMPDDFDYYRQYAIRTGSAFYSQKVIATGWNKVGWCGSDKGLRKISDCLGTENSEGKTTWKCINPEAELPPVWDSEEDFFRWINVPYILPEKRN